MGEPSATLDVEMQRDRLEGSRRDQHKHEAARVAGARCTVCILIMVVILVVWPALGRTKLYLYTASRSRADRLDEVRSIALDLVDAFSPRTSC
jgi:hypothetical protein